MKGDEQPERVVVASGATTESLLILFAAFFAGILAVTSHCSQFTACYNAGTCTNASLLRTTGLSCSFTNAVSVEVDRVYLGDVANGSFVTLTRSVCAPGERLHVNSVSGSTECAPYRAFPDALNNEIMSPGSSSRHTEMCGSWIAAGSTIQTSVEYWSFYDDDLANQAVQNVESKMYTSSRLSGSNDIGKFYTSCSQTVLAGAGAIRASAITAYHHLMTGMPTATTVDQVLKNAGWLASHACDGAVLVGMTVSGGSFTASIARGSPFSSGALARSLYTAEESLSLQTLAEEGNNEITATAFSSPSATIAELEYVFEGATGRTDHASISLFYRATPELDGLILLAKNSKFNQANAYLQGVAATCAFAMDGNLGIASTGGYIARAPTLTTARPPAAALGRLKGPSEGYFLEDVTDKTVESSSMVTWSQLKVQSTASSTQTCVDMARFIFPDRIDSEHFDLLISPALYDRLQEMTELLRDAVAHVVENIPEVASVLADPATVSAAVRATQLRIAGAPRGTWAGMQDEFADGALTSDDGPMLIAVKAAKAMHTSRMNLLFQNAGLCSGPAVYPALTTNAYVYPGGNCTHVLLGILRPPFADERYDNASLASRAGYVIAHEFAHNTLSSEWNTVAQNTLLSRYSANLHSEAIADVISSLAIVHSGLATATQVCDHVSQLWCARTPLGYAHSSQAVHPGPNERGDLLCATLADMGVL